MGATAAGAADGVRFLIFDIETRVDKALLNAVEYPGEGLSDARAYERRRAEIAGQTGGGDFVPLTYHVPVSIVFAAVDSRYVLRSVEELRGDVLGEAQMTREFWRRVDPFGGQLVSFNGRGFDLPVMELQALRHGCEAPRYFNEKNGLRSRWGGRHYDLYEFFTNSGAARLRGGFDLVCKLAGLPGKGEVSGSDVQQLWDAGRYDEVHRYCRSDVIQTYRLLLRVERMRGNLTAEAMRRAEEASAPFLTPAPPAARPREPGAAGS